jgi:pyrroloquinoline-quinone synthase
MQVAEQGVKLDDRILRGEQVVTNIKTMIRESNINDNGFYRTFRTKTLPAPVLKKVFQQYYYYIRTFPQILAGTSHRVNNELVRMKLARTVVSELGDQIGEPHFIMFERVLAAIGVKLDDWRKTKYTQEAEQLVDGLRRLFLQESTDRALGAHYVIEEFGFPMIVALYEGFRRYEGWTHESFGYFYLHMIVESDHVDWIRAAVLEASVDPAAAQEIEAGAREVLSLLADFWRGLDRLAQH